MKARFSCKTTIVSGIALLTFFACQSPDDHIAGPANKPQKDDPKRGETIFLSRCASCHKVNEDMTGPALSGAETSWIKKETLYNFVRNSQEVIKYDPYARTLWLKYNQTVMPPFPELTDGDIQAVFDYVETKAIR